MKYKKYILILLISLFIGCNNAYAADEKKCYYISDNFKATLFIRGGYTEVNIDKKGAEIIKNKEELLNWYKTLPGKNYKISEGNYRFDYYHGATNNKSDFTNITCPKYLVFQAKTGGFVKINGYKVYATEELSHAQNATVGIDNLEKYEAYYASYKDSSGNEYTANDYYGIAPDVEINGEDAVVDCNSLFGNKNDPDSIAYIIDEILSYVRIIVPILIILLGSLDLAKAVLAGKEDEMKKAQKTFIMRLIAGIGVFFVPVLVDIVMYLADIVWEGLGYSSCNI